MYDKSANQNFIELDPTEAEAMQDTLSGDDKFWAIISKALQGKMTCQELGMEILLRAETLDEQVQEFAKELERNGSSAYCAERDKEYA